MKDEWRTPPYLYRYASMLVGGFTHDAACRRWNKLGGHNTRPVHPRYGDALTVPWKGRIWCNPPYSDITPWVDAAFRCQGKVVMLIPASNGEERYRRLMEEAYEIAIIGRIGFIDGSGREVKGNPRGSSLFIIGDGCEGQRIVMNREDIRNWKYHT